MSLPTYVVSVFPWKTSMAKTTLPALIASSDTEQAPATEGEGIPVRIFDQRRDERVEYGGRVFYYCHSAVLATRRTGSAGIPNEQNEALARKSSTRSHPLVWFQRN